ncbi:MAG: class I mannose-6-phosphate isomerase [Oscillospiraceae bacterium]|nr:class I mannose-6-phosphate isomerase [Oscillospiraceae bacterium]
MSHKQPLKMLENRVWRIYLGGLLLDELRGKDGGDGCFPEDWLASVVPANNPPREDTPEREGLSRVELPDGSSAYLKDLIDADPEGFLGVGHIEKFGVNFGVLTKFLDSAERLPIQVHPDKQAAKTLFSSDYGKTESWYILNGRAINGEEPYILFGFKEDMTKERLRELFDAQDIAGMAAAMHKLPVKAGDVFIIEGGTPHAIGPGCFLLEVQEPTDYTISLEKCDMRGEKLPDFMCHMGLGFDKMFDCFHYEKHTRQELLDKFKLEPKHLESGDGYALTEIIGYGRTACFALNRLEVSGAYERRNTGKPYALAVVAGSGSVAGTSAKSGDCLFVPAMAEDFTVTGELTLLECLPPLGE